MKKRHFFSIISIGWVMIILETSCGNQSGYQIDNVTSVNLKGKNVGPTNFFLRPERILIDSTYILVLDSKKGQAFSFFDEKFNFLKSLGTIGKGPDEILSPKLSQQKFARNKSIVCYDSFQRKIVILKLNNVNDLKIDTIEKKEIPYDLVEVQNIQVIDYNEFVSRGNGRQGKLCFFNTNTKTLKFTDFYPLVKYDKHDRDFFQKYYGDLTYCPKEEKIACSNRFFNEIEIYSKNGDLITESRPSKLENPFSTPDYTYQYNCIYSTSKYIYASYLGVKDSNLNGKFMMNKKTQMHIFDWEGNLILILNLDRLTGYFAVDENNKYMLCTDETNQDQPFIEYLLPDYL